MVVRAKDLLAMDTNLFSEDSSDPYVIVRFDDLEMTSKVIKKTRDPTWNFDCQVAVSRDTRDTRSLELEVWDKDHVPPDDFLGRIRVPLKKLCHVKATESWRVPPFVKVSQQLQHKIASPNLGSSSTRLLAEKYA